MAFKTIDHPLIRHKMAILRDVNTSSKKFRELVDEIAMFLAFEATRKLPLEQVDIETPLETTKADMLSGKKLVLVPILRAGLGMLEGMRQMIPGARVGHIGIYRDEETLEPNLYFFKMPALEGGRQFFLLDPMLATGGSAVYAVDKLKEYGAEQISLLCIVAAPGGIRRLEEKHPDVDIFAAALDRQLNDAGYILPGLGDAGDRIFGTK